MAVNTSNSSVGGWRPKGLLGSQSSRVGSVRKPVSNENGEEQRKTSTPGLHTHAHKHAHKHNFKNIHIDKNIKLFLKKKQYSQTRLAVTSYHLID